MLVYRSRRCKSEIQPLGFAISNNIKSLSCTCRHQSVTGSLGLPLSIPLETLQYDITGFGVLVHPSGVKSFMVNYRLGSGGRSAPNKRLVIGRCDRIAPEQARREAHRLLGMVAMGENPAAERARSRRMPALKQAFEQHMAANPKRKASTNASYRDRFERPLADWLGRPLDAITRSDVEDRFNRITEHHGWATANQCLSLLRSVYRRPCVDFEGLTNPVDLWLAGGGKFHPKPRRKIPPPAEVLPRWRKGIEAVVSNPALRDVFWFGMYTGMRLGEVLPLRWERVNMEELVFRVDDTKTGAPLELPMTRQLAAILDRRWAGSGHLEGGWVFPSASSRTGYFVKLTYFHRRISEAGGAKFWFHGMRNCFITVAERELMLPHALTKRLVNHAPPNDVTEGYAADWTIGQLRGPAQRIADRIETLMRAESDCVIGGRAALGSR